MRRTSSPGPLRAALAPLCAGFLLLACGAVGNSTERTETMNAESGKPSLAERAARATAAMGITLPASATVEYADYTEGHDDVARLLVTMPTADWQAMKAAPPLSQIDPRAWSADNVFHLGPDAGAWNPETAEGIEAAQTHIAGGRQALNVGVAPPLDGMVRVYLHWFQL